MTDAELKKKVIWKGKLEPTLKLHNTQPIAVTSADARRIIGGFLNTGRSMHSGVGGTLWVLLDYLQGMKIPYTLNAYPGEGYEVHRAPELPY